ncbi:MAG: Unknown protein [uncultured Sulfurovum sp.]|uniref:Pyrrolidone-carboxylate peptidase n=1 Tax=uncultured Sulfurovum sp. TaxID=269237 RepID=A0A6S6S931_9BACT|nr:MAG: Unknown protein [uncultured Sulfurovum sp.]
MKQLRVLAAGYGKFNQYKTDEDNPAYKVAQAFKEEFLAGDTDKVEVKGYSITVPVVWDKAWPTIKQAVDDIQPDVLICMGAAGETKFERMARNEALTSALDADDKCFDKPYVVDHPSRVSSLRSSNNSWTRDKVSPDYENNKALAVYADDTPTPYFFPTTLPCDYLEKKMNNSSNSNILKVNYAFNELSFDAGDYLCNLAFYMPSLLLHGKVAFNGFLHLAPNKTEEEYSETGKFIFHELAVWLQRNYIREARS